MNNNSPFMKGVSRASRDGGCPRAFPLEARGRALRFNLFEAKRIFAAIANANTNK